MLGKDEGGGEGAQEECVMREGRRWDSIVGPVNALLTPPTRRPIRTPRSPPRPLILPRRPAPVFLVPPIPPTPAPVFPPVRRALTPSPVSPLIPVLVVIIVVVAVVVVVVVSPGRMGIEVRGEGAGDEGCYAGCCACC